MDERLQAEIGHRVANGVDVGEGVFAREHDTLDSERLGDRGAGWIVDRHLRRPMNLERRIQLADQANESDVLHDHGVDSAVDGLSEKHQRVNQFIRLDEDVQRQIDPAAPPVGEATGLGELVERELGAFVPGIELCRAEIDGVGAVGERGTNGVERSGGGKELGNGAGSHRAKGNGGTT